MGKNLRKFLGFCLGMAMLASPLGLSADSCGCPKTIKFKDVAGTYQISGFSNSLDGVGIPSDPTPQSQALVGQVTFNNDGTGQLNFIDFAFIAGGDVQFLEQFGVQFTYTLGPVNGQGRATLQNFPTPGQFPEFAVSFKMHKGKVVGFSQVTIANPAVPTPRWTLIQGDRFN